MPSNTSLWRPGGAGGGLLDKIRSVAGRFAGVGEASTKAFSELPGLDPHGDWPEQG